MAPESVTPQEIPESPPGVSAEGSESLSLSRDLGEFLIQFSIALNRTVMYPQGHPSLDDAAASVAHQLSSLLYERSTLSIGVARDQLVIDGVATDSGNPVLRSLAERLHEHHVGAVSFRRGLSSQEFLGALKVLATEPDADELPLGLGDSARLTVGPHVRLYPMTYERLEMVGDAESQESEGEDPHRNSRIASLWVGMARAALAIEAGDDIAPESVEPAAVARAINTHPSTQAYDQVIVGYLLQIAGELKSDGSTANATVRRHLSRMIEGLDDGALDRLLVMGGDEGQRTGFMLDAVDGMAADAVLDLARAASRASNQTLSDPLLRVLMKLASLAGGDRDANRSSAAADTALRVEIRRLMIDWTGNGATARYSAALDAAGHMRSEQASAERAADQPEHSRLLHTALELDETGPAVDRAIDDLVRGGATRTVLQALEKSAGTAADESWKRLGRRENIVHLLALDGLEKAVLDRLFGVTDPSDVATALIDAIIAGGLVADHANALSAMTRIGPQIAEEAGRRLGNEDSAVRLGMLGFLNKFGIVPPGLSPRDHGTDPDPEVRREALKLALVLPRERERAICMALTDSDTRVVRVGMRAVESDVPEPAVALLAGRVDDPELPMDLRTAAVRALGTVHSTIARDALLRVTCSGTSILGRPRLNQTSAVMLAGLAGLAQLWADDPKVAEVLKRARASSDSPTRAAARAAS